ncbi:MAG: hypothetical protein ACRDOK_01315 [Streptosporangiaceae bacterium]
MSRLPLTLRPLSRPADVPVRAQDQVPRARRLGRPARMVLTAAGWLLAAVALFTCYLHLSRTVPANSDGASIALQAWAMLHGNPLLRGWWLSDVAFYTTELPQYLLIEFVHGLNPDDMHIAAAMTYTLLVLLAAFVAKGRATGAEGLMRAALAVGIMVAPPQGSVYELMLEPDHVGSVVPVLLLVLVLDRAGRRWFVLPLAYLLVTWALIADQVILISAVGPLIFVAVLRGYRRLAMLRRRAWTAWFELGLVAAAAAGAATAGRILKLIRDSGGFRLNPVNNQLAWFGMLPHNALETLQGILVLFGANFPGHQIGLVAAVGLLHLVGIGLVLWSICVAVRRLWRLPIAVQLMAASVCFTVLAYLLGPNALVAQSSREIAAVLPLGAALAGRLLARRLRRARLAPALTAVLAIYLAGLVFYATRPPVPANNQTLAAWLTQHRLRYGLTPSYWLGNSTTVDSGGKVAVRTVQTAGTSVSPNLWEIDLGWYSARRHAANFVVMPGPGAWRHNPAAGPIVRSFGRPAWVYVLPDYTVLVWTRNVLSRLG